ncbi:MAG: carboxypeptidase-like regulatory domain-containing protein, partial [Desulfobacterales bacterium]|nr:carboxypeptidase-like regulatory domain-containing protein [Desulfobacterales bacterium]
QTDWGSLMKKSIVLIIILFIFVLIFLAGCVSMTNYSVSGYITDDEGNGLAEIEIVYSGGASGLVYTDVEGYWCITDLKGVVTITPQKEGWVFSPEKRLVLGREENVKFTGMEIYHENSEIQDVADLFLQGITDEDITKISNLIHPEYSGFEYPDKDSLLTAIVELLSLLEINNYERTIDFITFDDSGGSLDITMYINKTAEEEEAKEVVEFSFSFAKVADAYLITNLAFQRLSDFILNEDIFAVDGESDKISLTITDAGQYRIETAFDQVVCDTELFLYDEFENHIAYNDDSDGFYSELEEYLTPGTYYIIVKEWHGEVLSCRLSVENIN